MTSIVTLQGLCLVIYIVLMIEAIRAGFREDYKLGFRASVAASVAAMTCILLGLINFA